MVKKFVHICNRELAFLAIVNIKFPKFIFIFIDIASLLYYILFPELKLC